MGYALRVRQLLVGLALGVALAGCSTGGAEGSATPTPTVPATTTPAVQGPAVSGAVPAGAFVRAADLGPAWRAAPVVPTPCAPAYTRASVGSSGLAEQRGSLTETVATGVDVTAAVASWRSSLQRCGYQVRDDALGDASVTALSSDGADAVTVTGTDGVLVVLHAHGTLARAQDDLASWADLALGTSCVAAAEGCH